MTAALGTRAGQPGYMADADANDAGVIDASDLQILAGNFGFHANQPPAAISGSATTHEDLPVSVPLASLATDPEDDPLTFRITGVTHGTAVLSGDGQSVIFTPSPSFSGTGGFTVVADDGLNVSGPATVTVAVSSVPLEQIDVATRNPRLPAGRSPGAGVHRRLRRRQGVPLPASYLTFVNGSPGIADLSAAGSVTALAVGTTIVQVSSHGILAATAVDVGTPLQARIPAPPGLRPDRRAGEPVLAPRPRG